MNHKLSKEIYGSPWFIDPISFVQMSKTLESFQNGNGPSEIEEKANQFGILESNDLVFNARKISRMENVPKGSIAVYHFDSVITKHGGMSHYGTVEIAAQFAKMEANENVIGHIFFCESGGGAANAVKYMREASAKTARTKPLVSYIEDIGASALMYIASDSDHIFVKSEDAMIGSIGTMIALEGFANKTKDKNGKRHLRIYASQSINKNIEFEKAINDLNFEPIKSKILDPHCDQFIKDMEANRPNITPEQKTGAIFKAGECIGTLIDEIGSFDQAVEKVKELSKLNNFNSNQNFNTMNAEELKAKHPGVYDQVFSSGKQAGEKAEQNRVAAWLVFNDVNSDQVKAGIESGEEMSKAEELSFMRASQKAELQKTLEQNSADTLSPDKKTGKLKTKDSKSEEQDEIDAALEEMEIGKKEE